MNESEFTLIKNVLGQLQTAFKQLSDDYLKLKHDVDKVKYLNKLLCEENIKLIEEVKKLK